MHVKSNTPPEVVGAGAALIQREVQSQRAPGVPSLPRKKKYRIVKMAELLTEAQYVEQRQQIENQAEMLKIEQEIAKTKARVEAYSWKETICEKTTDRKILAPRLKTSDENESLCLSENLINHCNTKSGKSLSDVWHMILKFHQ